MKKRLIVVVEGQTEEAFCTRLIYPWLSGYDTAGPTKIDPSSSQQDRSKRGGHGHRFAVIEQHLTNTLRSRFDIVTTMLDLYHLPDDFPKLKESQKIPDPIKQAEFLEQALFERMGSPPTLVPNLIVHEIEALLFADPGLLATTPHLLPDVRREMCAVVASFSSPEHINHNRPPGKLLEESSLRHGRKYKKRTQGPQIAEQIGMEVMRSQCKHFAAWLDELNRRL